MTQKDLYHRLTVNIAVSPCDDALAIGYDERQMNRVTVRIAQYWLYLGARVIFGHDWREDGVMRAVSEFAEIASSSGSLRIDDNTDDKESRWRMLNVVPVQIAEELSKYATDAVRNSTGILQVATLMDACEKLPPSKDSKIKTLYLRQLSKVNIDQEQKLWLLRNILTNLLSPGLRICLGGKTNGYTGYYAGVAEEAYLALKYRKPLYLIGGFGGATRQVCAALSNRKLQGISGPNGLERKIPISSSQESKNFFDIPPNGLTSELKEFGMTRLCEDNGLSEQENRQLFETTDVEFALDLISHGMRANLQKKNF